MPIAASQMVARCTPRGSRSQPKIHSPRNVDSMKNAASPSIASGAPNTSPTKREYSLQFMPNWNSCTMPVTTPIAKLIRNSLPKNRVSRSQRSSPVRHQMVCMIATSGARPIVSGTNKKWYTVVIAELQPGHVQRVHELLPSARRGPPLGPRLRPTPRALGPAR